MKFNEASSTLSPLPSVLSHGLVAVSTFGLLSFFCSTSLFLYLTWRLISWHRSSVVKVPTNQFLFLIYNLLFADIQQALAFLLNITALRNNAILVNTPTCFAQGWFVSTGDLASSVFILTIAIHTFFSVVKDYKLPSRTFYCIVVADWVFIYLMAAIGPIMHGKDFYVRAQAWCWINDEFSAERLWLHYFWVFICIFSTIGIYAFVLLWVRRKSRSGEISIHAAHGAAPLMVLYPLIYTICTAPLAAGRIASLAGTDVSLGYFCTAGTLIACNGWLDVLLYASSRADIVFAELPGEETGLETFAFMGKGHNLGTTTTIQAGGGRSRSRLRSSVDGESMIHLQGMGQIEVKGEVSVVTTDAIHPEHGRREKNMSTSHVGADTGSHWNNSSVKSFDS
ncbi:hypothetical protein LSUB1_G001690 [Lachnellula subtilissima]|uniref:Glucose receptor Git3-like N-terminal domain-containing protein n=1 Tax=Lachnellula subtilissima TaxID=602034 RepID=A0A8H8UHD3_9HELO|nr:hypothetical protein LSUB1_G001690 [Lachnellula subtilissima]